MKSLAKKTVENISYKGFAQTLIFGIQSITSIIIAQQLTVTDIGIVGFVMVFITFLSSFSDLGVGSALVQRRNLDKQVINTAFTLRIILGILSFLVAIFISKIFVYNMNNKLVEKALQLMALIFLIRIAGFIPGTLMIRSLDYKRWILPNLLGAICCASVTCFMAYKSYGFWSVIFGELSGASITALSFAWMGKSSIKLRWHWPTVLELLKYGFPLFCTGLVVHVLFKADNFIIGLVSGANLLGYYSLAFSWGSMISRIFNEIVGSVMFPTMSLIQNDRARLRSAYMTVIEHISVFGVLGYIVLFCCAEHLLVLVLGKGTDKWLPAANVLRIMCVYGLVRLLTEPVSNLFMALGKTTLLFKGNLLAVVMELLLIYPALNLFSIEGVAIAVTISYAIQWTIYWTVIKKELDIKISEFVRMLKPTIIAGILTCISGCVINLYLNVDYFGLLSVSSSIIFLYIVLQGVLSSWKWYKQLHLIMEEKLKKI